MTALTRARAKQAESIAPWAQLLPEVTQRIAELLDDQSRAAILRTCTAWCAAIQAVPALWPEVELRGPYVAYGGWGLDEVPFDGIQQSLRDAAAESRTLLEQAAGLDPLTWRVRIEGCEHQPSLVHAVLAVLPPTVRQLRLHVDCYGPLFTVLQRMPQLDSFSIGGTWGNGAHLQWGSPAATAAVRKLTSLRLNFREAPEWDGEFHLEAEILPVPDALPCVLAAATRLTSLELLVKWQGGVAQLCAALPALQDLRLTLYMSNSQHSHEAVAALAQLPRLSALALTVHSGWAGSQEDPITGVDMADWEEWASLPSLAPLADRLTALTLAGAVSLSPDWRNELQGLRQLRIVHDGLWASTVSRWFAAPTDDKVEGFSWGTGSWSRLTALTSLCLSQDALLPDVEEVATAPNLASVLVYSPGANNAAAAWKEQLRALRPAIETRG